MVIHFFQNTRSSNRLQSSRTQLRENNEDPSETDLNVLSKDHDYCALSKTITPEKELPGCTTNNGLPERLDTLQGSPGTDTTSTTAPDAICLESTNLGTQQDNMDVISQEKDCRHSPVFPINTSDYRFECICGSVRHPDLKDRVQCLQCHLWQHAECVNYKRESVNTTPFYCPHCLVAMDPVPTGATLIISPSSICHQWVDEINRHVRSSSLHVMVRILCVSFACL